MSIWEALNSASDLAKKQSRETVSAADERAEDQSKLMGEANAGRDDFVKVEREKQHEAKSNRRPPGFTTKQFGKIEMASLGIGQQSVLNSIQLIAGCENTSIQEEHLGARDDSPGVLADCRIQIDAPGAQP